jgi:exonuclease SbcC
MPEMHVTREALSHLLFDLKDIDESVVRGEKRLGSKTYAVAYIDLADQVVARSQNLREFQERVLGDDFFDATGDLRWNKYLYIVAGPNSISDAAAFSAAKEAIEADKDYARKRVVSEIELETLLGGPKLFEPTSASQAANILADWELRLHANELDLLLDCPTPRTSVVERVAQGNAKRESLRERARPLNAVDRHLTTSKLAELAIENFRPIHNGKTYRFGQVTLVIGPNGSGKTSLLEAIEFLYCGHNRRDNSASSLQVNAKFTKLETGEEFSLMSTVDIGRIRARCLAWYNRDERNAKAIVDGFTRYNFLDTDAAFRISTDLEPDEVSIDLSRLLVGPSAAVTWDYLNKIQVDIDRAWEKTQGSADRQKLVLEASEKALKEIQDRPSIAKALAESYRQTLAELGWLNVPANPRLEQSEGKMLLTALAHIQALTSASTGGLTVGALLARQSELDEAVTLASRYQSELDELHPTQQTLMDDVMSANAAIKNIDRWITYVSSGFPKLSVLAPKTVREAQDVTVRLGKFVVGQIPDSPSEYQTVSLEVAKHVAKEALVQAEVRVEELRRLADNHGRAAAERASSANSLKQAVLASLAQTSNLDVCPVCRTMHPPGELARLLESITDDAAQNPELQQTTEALHSAQLHSQAMLLKHEAIEFADVVALQLGLGKELSASEVFRRLVALRLEAAELSQASRSVSDELRSLEHSGFSANEYDHIWNQISSVFPDGPATVDAAATMRQKLQQDIERMQQELSEIQSKMMSTGLSIRAICKQVSSPEWTASARLNETFATLVALRDEFKFVLAHVEELQRELAISSETSLTELQTKLASTSAAFEKAFAIERNEANYSTELGTLNKAVIDGALSLRKMQDQASALRKAVDVLSTLLAEASLEKATQESLAAIANQINEIFSRIHSPREYEYAGKSDALLRTAVSQEGRNLEQVSTGQRAAFALSVFLALNETARAAPPIMLIDDPIAHIDDLNALSFLDYLRDLAVHSGRQIFFATADTRIASLFSKKFSFLGDALKTIQLARGPSA